MYEYKLRRNPRPWADQDKLSMKRFRGGAEAYLSLHAQQVAKVTGENPVEGCKSLAPELFDRIVDFRTLFSAWEWMSRYSGKAAGPDRLVFADYSRVDAINLCRCLSDSLGDGSYRPGPTRAIDIPKQSGKGVRRIVVHNVVDRVVQRACLVIMQPVLDSLFSDTSFGCRKHKSHLHALAYANGRALNDGRYVWVSQDIRDAFGNIPVPRVLDVVRKFLKNDQLLELLATVIQHDGRGLAQGGSLSPLLANLYLHHFIDRPWIRSRTTLPLIRVVDDLLVLCKSQSVAKKAHERLSRLTERAGLSLKYESENAVADIREKSCEWLGFSIRDGSNALDLSTSDRSWDRLDSLFVDANRRDSSPLRAWRAITQWISARGPAWAKAGRKTVYPRIRSMAAKHAFREIPSADEVNMRCSKAYARWRKLRKAFQPSLRPLDMPAA